LKNWNKRSKIFSATERLERIPAVDTPQQRPGLVMAAGAGRFVDVTRQAAETGLMACVRLHPDVWALCGPRDEPDAWAVRERHVRELLATLTRHLPILARKPVTFPCPLGARRVLLSARWRESEGRGAIEVYLGDF
jgi:hypothetical protein